MFNVFFRCIKEIHFTNRAKKRIKTNHIIIKLKERQMKHIERFQRKFPSTPCAQDRNLYPLYLTPLYLTPFLVKIRQLSLITLLSFIFVYIFVSFHPLFAQSLPSHASSSKPTSSKPSSKPSSKSLLNPTPKPQVTCIASMNEYPLSWQAPKDLTFKPSQAPWSAKEEKLRKQAVQQGLEEMIVFMQKNPTRIHHLWDNSVEAFIDVAYGINTDPSLSLKSLKIAAHHLEILAQPSLINLAGVCA